MPTLPEEEEDSPEELDSLSSSPSSVLPAESKVVNITISPPAIVLPRQVNKQEPAPLEKARRHSPRPRLSRNASSSGPITTVDNDGHVIDLVKDELPEMQLSEEDRQKNLELLEEAKKVSDRFLTRRGRRSTCSTSESPTGLSPNPTPGSSPVPSRSSSISAPPQMVPSSTEVPANPPSSPSTSQRLEVPAVRDHGEANKPEQETLKKLVEWKPPEKRKVSSGTLTPRLAASAPAKNPTTSPKDGAQLCVSVDRGKKPTPVPMVQKPDSQTPATGVAKPVPRPAMQQAPCTAEIKTIGAFPPLMRAVSWDTVGSLNMRNGGPKEDDGASHSDNLKPPVNAQKLSKLREEHKLLRNQSISGSKLPDLSETAEHDRAESTADEESKEKADAMPNISDIMLRKLKLHRGLPGCAPPLTEKEVENAFVQLSLAFRNDNYTLDTRLKQAERERNLTEENTEKELEEFKNSLKSTVSVWQNAEQREFYQRLIETVAVLHRLANRLSSRAEMVGAVRQEKRMNKATEVMLQYVENLKRTYEKDHAELMEFKKLANQNSNRCYGGSMETGDDGVPRAARSMSLTMGKALPRRRVSVAVVPKFNLLNIPGQAPTTGGPAPGSGVSLGTGASPSSGPGALPVLCEANGMKSGDSTSDPAQQAAGENGKVLLEQEGETATPAKASCSPEEIRAEIKAKIEEEAYNKGYQEGLKRLKELQEVKEEEEKAEEKEPEERTKEELEEEKKPSRFDRILEVLERMCPKIFRRNWMLWIALTLFLVAFFVVNLLNFFSNLYADHTDATAEKSSNVPDKKKLLGLHVGSKSPSPE
ncbi:inositol 1,4,5-triphosphate receptor associated 1 isoform X2 [Neoarius graeffei]|uniref:inositol 1,4,5-triphosphate receptor associated 1 isoform X2 n=1 Tax=Neoarius graeffei TaxID=443677 RepID=UPI00298CB8BC|nr:inositol 1,4,5-triphosphate receptor associated 1 isoform X2 [Neoarius graeffei]